MKNGFTLIEILVVVGIMGVLAAVGVSSYNKIGDRSKAQQTAQLIVTYLRSAQKDADSGVGSGKCAGVVFEGVAVNYVAADDVIKIDAVCNGANIEMRSVPFKLERGVTVSGLTTVTFLPLSQGFSSVPGDIAVISGSNTFAIEFTSAGSINVSP